MRIDAASVLVRDGRGRVLLVLRGAGPNQGRWSLPGGKTEPGEGLPGTAARELAEETGLRGVVGDEVAVVDVDVPSGPGYRIHVFTASVPERSDAVAADDAAAAGWFLPTELRGMALTEGLLDLIVGLEGAAGGGCGVMG